MLGDNSVGRLILGNAGHILGFRPDSKVVIVSEKPPVSMPPKCEFISVRSFSDVRFSQLRSAVMIGLARGTFGVKEKICCLGGVRDSNLIDTIVMLDIGKEFSNVFIGQKNMLPEGVTPEVLERVLDIATELSVEGREGKPVGCIFVIGSAEELKPHLKQLILNPFYGYKPEDRNVLNPFMDETVKEYSLIDGAFIIDSSGVLEAAGALTTPPILNFSFRRIGSAPRRSLLDFPHGRLHIYRSVFEHRPNNAF